MTNTDSPIECLCDPLKGIKWTSECPIHGIPDKNMGDASNRKTEEPSVAGLQASSTKEKSDTAAAFQRLPSDLAKALNYGMEMKAEDYVKLCDLWNSKGIPNEISDVERIKTAIFNTITQSPPGQCIMLLSERNALMRDIFEAIRPYLRTTEIQCPPTHQPDEERIAYHERGFDEMKDIFLLESLRCAGLNICEPALWMGICRSAMKRLSKRESGEVCNHNWESFRGEVEERICTKCNRWEQRLGWQELTKTPDVEGGES